MNVALLPFFLTLKRHLELNSKCNRAETENHVSELKVILAPFHAMNEYIVMKLTPVSRLLSSIPSSLLFLSPAFSFS